MATIGRSKAIVEVGAWTISGYIAWLLWLFVHVMALVGFRNRVVVLMEWAWAYVSWQRSARVIQRAKLTELVQYQRNGALRYGLLLVRWVHNKSACDSCGALALLRVLAKGESERNRKVAQWQGTRPSHAQLRHNVVFADANFGQPRIF